MLIEENIIQEKTDLLIEVLQKLFINFAFASFLLQRFTVFFSLKDDGVFSFKDFTLYSISIWSILILTQIILDIQQFINKKFFNKTNTDKGNI